MRITVLGKSPAWQDADGACSGYLVEGGGQTILLDCGPGVFAKLRRFVDYVDVDAVVITHLHADHILDLVPYASGLRYAPRPRAGGSEPARPRLFAPPGAPEAFARLCIGGSVSRIRGLPGDIGRIPIVAMTANAMASDEEACRAAGMDDFVSKPFKADAFVGVLVRVLLQAADAA